MRFNRRRTTAFIFLIVLSIAFLAYARIEYKASRIATELTQEGIEALESGLLDEAEASFKQAIEKEPNYASAWLNLGLLYEQKGQLPLAVETLEKAITLTHNIEAIKLARYRLGLIYGDVGLTESVRQPDWYDRAVWHFDRLLKEEPENPEYHLRLGFAAIKAANPGKGLPALDEASRFAVEKEHEWIHHKLLEFYLAANMKEKILREKEIVQGYSEEETNSEH